MAISSNNKTRQTNRTVISVRIPNDTDGELMTEVERRLSRADGIADVSVEELRELEPGLSATVVTVGVTVETIPGESAALEEITGVEVRDRLQMEG